MTRLAHRVPAGAGPERTVYAALSASSSRVSAMRTTGSPAKGATSEGQGVSASSNAVAILVWPDLWEWRQSLPPTKSPVPRVPNV